MSVFDRLVYSSRLRLFCQEVLVRASVPNPYLACAVFSFRDLAAEVCIGKRVVFYLYGQSPCCPVSCRLFRNSPTLENAACFQPEIIVQPGSMVLLHHEDRVATGL